MACGKDRRSLLDTAFDKNTSSSSSPIMQHSPAKQRGVTHKKI